METWSYLRPGWVVAIIPVLPRKHAGTGKHLLVVSSPQNPLAVAGKQVHAKVEHHPLDSA
ncbi:hypothetical protein [Bradyrhizobium sp. SZCCHNR1015]|uniref:hypothetical protein n=1 Tax=unclassified Bradyrhizobium TaxID=2631580 RepID=UPI0029167B81|nr:hypothetical protein [Bradyrhizobium sp. SZCCHNR1015]